MAVRRKGFEKYGGFGSAQPVHSPSAAWLWRFRHVMSNDEHHGGLLCAPPVQPVPKGLLLAPAKTVREGAQTTNESKPGPHRRSGAPPRAVSLHTAPLLVCVDLNGKGGSRHAAYSPTWSQRGCNGVPLARTPTVTHNRASCTRGRRRGIRSRQGGRAPCTRGHAHDLDTEAMRACGGESATSRLRRPSMPPVAVVQDLDVGVLPAEREPTARTTSLPKMKMMDFSGYMTIAGIPRKPTRTIRLPV